MAAALVSVAVEELVEVAGGVVWPLRKELRTVYLVYPEEAGRMEEVQEAEVAADPRESLAGVAEALVITAAPVSTRDVSVNLAFRASFVLKVS